MCVKEVYYNTYADGKEDVTEMLYPCREGKVSHSPDVRKYERRLSFNKGDLDPEPRRPRSGSFYLGADLPTPRRSKSPSPGHRREAEPAAPESPKATKHREYRDREDHRAARRRSLRLLEAELEKERARARAPSPPPLRKLRRTNTTPHVVVIEQGAPRFSSRHGLPDGPIHVAEEYIAAARPSRDYERDLRRRHSTKAKEYVIIEDERDRRRQTREGKRRLSVSSSGRPDISLMTPPAEGELRRNLRRSSTVVVPGASGSNTGSSGSSPPKHLRWEDQVRHARERHNDEIANRPPPPEGSKLKSILKPAGSPVKTKLTRVESDLGGLRQAVENMDLPTGDVPGVEDDLKLYDRDRLLARFGGSETDSDRERRRSKVWVSGERFKYM